MSCSLPIACSNLPIFKEITNNNAIYFNPNKIQDIKKKTIHLINNHKLRAKIAKKNFYIAKNFSWENCTKETINILKNV